MQVTHLPNHPVVLPQHRDAAVSFVPLSKVLEGLSLLFTDQVVDVGEGGIRVIASNLGQSVIFQQGALNLLEYRVVVSQKLLQLALQFTLDDQRYGFRQLLDDGVILLLPHPCRLSQFLPQRTDKLRALYQ